MAELKTRENDGSVEQFLGTIQDAQKQSDCREVMRIMEEVTGAEPKMWGGGIVGLGNYRYKYESGREGDWFVCGFSPRKEAITLYFMSGIGWEPELMAQLGKYKNGKGCLYIKKLADVNREVLRKLVVSSAEHLKKTSPGE